MTPREYRPSKPLLPEVPRVLWRAGTPPSRAGCRMEMEAESALALLAGVIHPEAATITFDRLPGNLRSFFRRLEPSEGFTVMAATLGPAVDARLDRLLKDGRYLSAHMFDSAASEAVELLAAGARMDAGVGCPGLEPSARLAPGYGGVPLEVQTLLIGLFPGLGITCTGGFNLLPQKTLTGVWGWAQRKD